MATTSEATKKFLKRLRPVMERGRKRMSAFREQRIRNLEAYVGRDYTGRGDRRPINQAYAAISVFLPLIAAKNPSADTTTEQLAFRPFAYAYEAVQDWNFERMNIVDTVRLILLDAILGMGISKTGIGETPNKPAGETYCKRISPDHLHLDPDCDALEDAAYIGDAYSIRKDLLRDSDLYENWAETVKDEDGAAESVGGRKGDEQQLYDMVDVVDLWLAPGSPWSATTGVLITIPAANHIDEVLRVVESESPYDTLSFMPVVDSPMPLAPATSWAALDNLINSIARKLENQVRRSKTLLLADPAARAEAETIRDAKDGDVIIAAGGERMKEINFGGPDAQAYSFEQWLIQMFSRQAGNIDMLGGLSADANTATEAVGLQANSKIRLSDQKRQVYKFLKSVTGKLAMHLWNDPMLERMFTRTISGLPLPLEVPYSPQFRELWGGSLDHYKFDVKADSMEAQDPERHAENLMTIVERVILPTAQIAAMQGAMLDVTALVQTVGKEMKLSELNEIYRAGSPSAAGVTVDSPEAAKRDTDRGQPNITLRPGAPDNRQNPAAANRMPQKPQASGVGQNAAMQ